MILSARGLTRRVGDRVLFAGLDLEVGPGLACRVAGPSGSGKTQLLRCLARLSPLDEGTVTLGGRTSEAWGAPAWRAEVCYVAQRPPSLAGTAAEQVARVAGLAAQRGREAEDPVPIAERWGLPASAWRQPWTELSGGEQQRAWLALVLSRRPAVLLLDEPTSALDPEATVAVERTLAGRAVVWVTHDAAQAERVGGVAVRL